MEQRSYVIGHYRIAKVVTKDYFLSVCMSVCLTDFFLQKSMSRGSWVKKNFSQKRFQTSGKHVLDNLRDKKNSSAEIAGVWGRSPQWGQGGEAPRHKTISPLINDNNVNNKNDFIYSKCTMVRPLHYIPWQHSILSGSIISR